jgi:glucose/mannose-6-phosphate isomerase
VTSMSALVDTLPEQLRWAADAEVPAVAGSDTAVVAGMGGSGIAGDFAAVVAAAEGRRVTVHKSYGLPPWAAAATPLVVAVSHSGNTEETLSAFAAARGAGLVTAALSVGGDLAREAARMGSPHMRVPDSPQPRAALGHLTGGVLRMLESAGVLSSQREGLIEAADVVEAMLAGSARDEANRIAEALLGRVVVAYGGEGLGAVAASRWKTQINENSKAPAYWAVLPEANHNEIVGWSAHPRLSASALGAVFLEDSGDHPRVRLRSRVTRDLMTDVVPVAGVVESRGTSALARLMSLSVIGDLVSVRLAELAGVDPVPVAVIEHLKQRLAEE